MTLKKILFYFLNFSSLRGLCVHVMATKNTLLGYFLLVTNPLESGQRKVAAARAIARISFEKYVEIMEIEEQDVEEGKIMFDSMLTYCGEHMQEWLRDTDNPVIG